MKYVHASLYLSLSRYVLVVDRHVKGGMAGIMADIGDSKTFQSSVHCYY